MIRFAASSLLGCAALAGCAESPPPPRVEGEVIAMAVQLADARADAVRSGKAAPASAAK